MIETISFDAPKYGPNQQNVRDSSSVWIDPLSFTGYPGYPGYPRYPGYP